MVAFDGVVLSDLATPCDVFGRVRNSKGRLAYEVRVCTFGRQIRSAHLKVATPWRLASLRHANTIIVPGIEPIDRAVPEQVVRALRRGIARGARV
ncbi:MAG: AraC family transcriptional regulator, partial [Acidobacteriia bacterium]|nr:AraC family transcriptional regulator [Terriglobia bacterium]